MWEGLGEEKWEGLGSGRGWEKAEWGARRYLL